MIRYPTQLNIILSILFYFILIIGVEILFLSIAVESTPLKDTVQNVSINEIFTAPKFTNDLNAYKKVVKSEGSSLKLKCDSEGNPQSVISWTKNEQLILQRGEDAVKVFRSGIVFENLTVTDSGNYKCDVDNEKGHIDFTYEVDVIERQARKPYIKDRSNITAYANKNVNFECIAESELETFIEWYYHNVSFWKVDEDNLRQGTLFSIWNGTGKQSIEKFNLTMANVAYNWRLFERETLSSNIRHKNGTKKIFNPEKWQLFNVTYEDEGWYTCVAINRFNRSLACSYLRVVNEGTIKFKYFLLAVLGILLAIGTCIYIVWSIWRKRHIKWAENQTMTQWFKKIVIENENNPYETRVLIPPKVKIERDQYLSTDKIDLYEYKLPLDPVWEFSREKLSLGKSLGEGAFGKVVQGDANGILRKNETTTVGVKMLNDGHTDSDMLDFVSEMEIMKIIGSHKNITNLLGCCTQNGPLYLLVEYAEHGNLRDFLRKHRSSSGIKPFIGSSLIQHLTTKALVVFAHQIANGMEYLASRECIHRDLAARNVLVSKDLIMKISDFGLAKDIHNRDYYKKTSSGKVPVKWMAPESLFLNVYTSQSDVWSYGVLLWEIMTLGGTPYHCMPDIQKLYKMLMKGYRMERPASCPLDIYLMMRDCWTYEADERPTFKELGYHLDQMLLTMTDQEYEENEMPPLDTPPSSQD